MGLRFARIIQYIKVLNQNLFQAVLQGHAVVGKLRPDGEFAALEAVGIFDLPEKFGNPMVTAAFCSTAQPSRK